MNLNNLKDSLFGFLPKVNSEKLRLNWAKKQLKKIPTGQNIIDVGAGEMLFKQYCSHIHYTSQDLAKYKGRGDKKGLQKGVWDASKVDIISDITKIPVKNSVFDNVLCTAVLEHVPFPDLAIKEITRILKRGGKLILDAPFCSQTHFSPYFFATGFSSNWYKLILPKYGLKIIRMEPYGNYFDYLSQELLRLPLVAKRYSVLGVVSLLLYLFTIPLIILIEMISRFSKDSEQQLCFGYHVIATKK